MKKNRIIELVVKVAVAALTAFLTALGTTSCMGHGPIWWWMVKGSWWMVVFNSLSNLEPKWVKSPAGNVLAGLSSFRLNRHTASRWVSRFGASTRLLGAFIAAQEPLARRSQINQKNKNLGAKPRNGRALRGSGLARCYFRVTQITWIAQIFLEPWTALGTDCTDKGALSGSWSVFFIAAQEIKQDIIILGARPWNRGALDGSINLCSI